MTYAACPRCGQSTETYLTNGVRYFVWHDFPAQSPTTGEYGSRR